MGLLDWIFKTNKKPKKKERDKWAKEAEKAKKNTQSNSKRKSASYKSETAKQKTTSAANRSTTASSRRGSYVSSATTQRAQTQSKAAVKRQTAYDKYRARVKAEQNRRDLKALQRTTGKTYKNNQEIKPAIYTGDPEQYKEYSTVAKVLDKNADKTVYDAKTGTSKGQTLKEYYSAPEHKKEALKEKKKTEEFINEHPVAAGFGDAYSKLVGRGVEDYKDIFSGIKGTKKERTLDTKKYDKSKAAKVANMAGVASQYLLTGGGAGLARSAGAKMLGKLTAKEGAKTIAKATAKKALKEGAKRTTKKLSKEGVKKFAKNRAAEIAADMPLDVAHSYKDSKGDTKEFAKEMRNNLLLNIGVGSGMEYGGKALKALKGKAVAKSAMKKAAKGRKETAKAVKGALESLDNRAKEQGDYLSDLRTKMGVKAKETPKQKPVKGKTVKKAKAETELTIENIRTGKKITGRPRNKQEAQMMLRVASRGAKSTDDIRTSTKEVGSPQATHRQPTSNSQATHRQPTSNSQATVEQPTVSKSQADVQGKRTELGKLKEQSNEVARDVEELSKKYQNNPAEMMNDPEYGRLMRKHDDIEERINDLSEEVEQPKTGNHEQITSKSSGETVETSTVNGEEPGASAKKSHENETHRRFTEKDKGEYLNTGKHSAKHKIREADRQGKKVILTSKAETDNYIENAISGKSETSTVGYGWVNGRVAKSVKEVGHNIDDYHLELTSDDIWHSYRNHAEGTQEGDIALSIEDYKNIPEYIDTADDLLSIKTYKDGSKKLLLGKKINGHTIIVETIADSKKSMHFKNMWGVDSEKYSRQYPNKKAITSDGKDILSSKTPDGDSLSDSKISKSETNVNPKDGSNGTPPENRTPAEAKKVAEEGEPVAKIKSRLEQSKTKADKTFFRKAKVGLQKAFVDAGAAFENIARNAIKNGDKKLGGEVYDAVNSLRQTSKSVEYQILDAQTDLNYHRIGESIHDIIDPLRKNDVFDDAQALLFHEHNIDRMKQNKPVFGESIDGSASRKEIDRIRNKYDAGTLKLIDDQNAKIKQYFKNLKQMRVDAGLMSKDVSDYLDELYPNYVQTKRMGDVTKGVSSNNNIIGATKGKNATGSSRDLLSIDDQMIRATNEVWRGAKNNNLITKVVELQGGTGKALKDGTDLDTVLADSLFAEEVKKGEYRLRYFENGEAKTIDCDEEVYKSLKSLNGQGWNPPEYAKKIADITAGSANSIFKKLCTEWNPFFALYRNPMRDLQDALMYSKDFGAYITHMPVAIKRMVKKDEYWQLWKASGGTASSLFDITSKIKKSKNPLRRVGLMNQAVEQYPRFTEFCAQLDKQLNGKPVSSATREMIDKASQAGADITVNFGRTGDVTKLLNRYAVPFLNPGVQGVSKAVRLVTERSGAKAFIGLATKAAALGFTPAVINEALMHDDKGYQQMNARDKLTNYIFKLGDNYVKIPKGRLLSLIGMGGMKTANTAYGGDDYTFDEMMDVAKNQSAPANPFSDNLAMTAYNAINNKTWYGGNIQSDYDEDNKVDQTKVYDANTTSLAKELAKTDFFKSIENANKVKGVSPKKIDAMLKGYSGVLGELAMPLMTQKSKGAGLQGVLGNLAKKTFTIDPRYQNELSTKFYEKVSDSARTADETGKAKDKTQSKYYSDQSKRVSAINKIIKDVQNSDRSYEEKNKMVDALTDRRNKLMDNALKGVKMADDYKMRDMDAVADVVGKSKALDYAVGNKTDKAARKAVGNDEKFYKGYRAIQSMGASSKTAKSVALVSAGADKKVYEAYGIKDDYRQRAKDYFKNGGSTEEFTRANEITAGSGNDYMLKAMKLAKAKAPDRVYAVNDIYQSKMLAARVLSKAGYKDDFFASKNLKPKIDTDGSGRYTKAEVYNFVSKQKASTNVKNALWSAIAYKNMKPMFGSPTVPKENYKLKGASGSPKGSSKTASGKPGQVDYSKPASREFMNNFGANMDKERRRVGEKLYRAAQSSVRGINAPYKNDKDYLPKETLQVVRSGDERLDTEALKALKSGGIKALVKQAQKNLPKIKEPDDNTTFDDGDSSGGGGGYYRRYGRRGHGRGGSGGSGSSGTATKKPEEIKTKDAKYDPSTWNPTKVSTDSGWTDSQIRKVYNTLIKQGLTQQQAVARIAQLWHTRFS